MSWSVEAIPVPEFEANVLVFLPGRVFVFGERFSRIQNRSFRTETTNLEIRGGQDVDVPQRPGSRFSSVRYILIKRNVLNLPPYRAHLLQINRNVRHFTARILYISHFYWTSKDIQCIIFGKIRKNIK